MQGLYVFSYKLYLFFQPLEGYITYGTNTIL